MTKQEITAYLTKIHNNLQEHRIKAVFDLLTSLSLNLQNWQLREKLFELEENYKRMLSFVSEGFEDPEREKIYNELLRSLYQATDIIGLDLKTANDSSFFYEKRRSYFYSPQESPAELFESLNDILGKLDLLCLIEDETNSEVINIKKQEEIIYQKAFSAVWLSNHWSKEVRESWIKSVDNPLIPDRLTLLVVSAITLNLLETFDEQKALFLLEESENKNEEIRQRALTGIVIFLRKYDKRLYLYPSITSRLQHLQEDKRFVQDIRNILQQFILSRETEKISRKIKDELIPKMMKMGPKFQNKFRIDDISKELGMDEKNPEWEKMIKDEGLESQFQEISELQMEGADVMHSSFSHLKNYPFFHEISNWFLPFQIPADSLNNHDLKEFSKLLEDSTMICNSDKYSFFLSISQMPDNYRKMMMGQFSAESSSVQELLKEESVAQSKKISAITRQYIQDLYRFFKLFPRRTFEDIFDSTPEFYEVPSIFEIIKKPLDLYIIGEYYFSKNYFKEASIIFEILINGDPNNEIIYQKLGYCYQMMGDLEKAEKIYSKAELLNPNNPWLIKKLAYCNRLLKDPKKALTYYKKAEKITPNNLSILLNIGHCYLELKDYDEALKYYFKVEYLEPEKNKNKAWRPIAWCSFLIGKYDQAMGYYDKIMNDNPNATDYLNAGHTQLAIGNNKEAIRLYSLSIKHPDNTLEKFMESFNADIHDLIQVGINTTEIPFLLDQIMYNV